MDPQSDLPELVEDLEVNIDELTTALAPLLDTSLHSTASTLPLLDKAKLYVLSAYAIESLLFSTLQASGANAKEHAIFKELARLKGYFAKIKQIETADELPKTRIDKAAAARFIKHGLAGNTKYDLERAERIAKEKAKAAIKARQLHLKFDQAAEEAKQQEYAKKRKVEEEQEAAAAAAAAVVDDDSSSSEDHVASENEAFYGPADAQFQPEVPGPADEPAASQPVRKKPRLSAADRADASDSPFPPSALQPSDKKSKSSDAPTAAESSKPSNKAAKRAKKAARKAAKRAKSLTQTRPEEVVLPGLSAAAGPRAHSATFNALLDGSFAEQKKRDQEGIRKKRKRKNGKKGKAGEEGGGDLT